MMVDEMLNTIWRRGSGQGSWIAVEEWETPAGISFYVYEISKDQGHQLLSGPMSPEKAIAYARGVVAGTIERPFV
jgi:hypothetical protein